MALANNGPHGHFRGRIGNLVYYTLKGQQVVRVIGKSDKPPTDGQIKTWAETKMCATILKYCKAVLEVGFSAEARGTTSNPFNMAMKCNRSTIIKGTFPELSIDFSKLMLSKGDLKQAANWQVTEVSEGIRYSWDADPQMDWPEATDQVMMVAYFPGQEKAIYTLFGNSRLSGNDLLKLPASLRGEHVQTYMAFVSADRKQLSDSQYTGHFNTGK